MPRETVTLKDVAKHAGVSVGTVSRYLNNHPSVSERARATVAAAIAKLDYTPNSMAQKLARGISATLLLYIYQEFPIRSTTWLFELPVIQGIYEHLRQTDYHLQIAIQSTDNSEMLFADVNKYISSRQVDGILILSSWTVEKKVLLRLMDANFPYVLIGSANHLDHSNAVLFDNARVVDELVRMLHAEGHRKFAFFGGCEEQYHTRERFRGFQHVVGELGVHPKAEWIKFGDFSMESGMAMMNEVLAGRKNRPTAMICGNDYIAAGVVKSLKEQGIDVPGGASVTGFDNTTVAQVVEPALTTVEIPLYEMGKLATKRLIHSIGAANRSFSSDSIDCRIIIRDSIGRSPSGKRSKLDPPAGPRK